MAAPLITVAQLEDYLQRPLDADAAALAVEMASGLIRAWCGWEVSHTAETMTLDGSGLRLLNLPTLHVNAVLAVRVDDVALATTDYQWSVTGQLIRSCGWPCDMRSIQVDVDHGFIEIPGAVTAVGLALASRVYENPSGYKSVATGTASRSWHGAGSSSSAAASTFSGVELWVLGPYQLPMSP